MRNKIPKLPLILQPDAALDVHGDAAKVRLISEIDKATAERAVRGATILVLEPLFRRVDAPIRSLQQVRAKPLSMATNFAVSAILELSIRFWSAMITRWWAPTVRNIVNRFS
jgi:hypothetical protein